MSAHAKIAANNAKIAKLQAENEVLAVKAATEVNTEALVVGDTVTATYGRGETATSITGVVRAIKAEPNKAKLVKIEVGSGFDTEIKVVFSTQITSVAPVGAPEVPETFDALASE